MSQQPMNLRRVLEFIRRNKGVVGAAIGIGLIVGAAFGSFNPPVLTGSALVILPNSKTTTQTFQVIATSDPVLAMARPGITPVPADVATLRKQVTTSSPSPNIISINAQNPNAAAAENTANTIATTFVGYLASSQSAVGQLSARVLQPATTASGPNPLTHRSVYGLGGAIAGLLVGIIVATARGRADRRLRSRDDLANSIGVPVLASLPVSHPSNAQDWAKLLDSYEPAAVHGWRLRKTLQHLNVAGVNLAGSREGEASTVAVVSLDKDSRALALGPQLAVFAASLGIPTLLAIGASHDPEMITALKVACAGSWQGEDHRGLRVAILGEDGPDLPGDIGLTVVIAVVDGADQRPMDTLQATATLLGVSAGAATAEQLACLAMSSAAAGREVIGLLVADPDPSDRTTGRIPQLPRVAPRMPTRHNGVTTEARR
jgi:capsular polysaccharide biosynthesis protein